MPWAGVDEGAGRQGRGQGRLLHCVQATDPGTKPKPHKPEVEPKLQCSETSARVRRVLAFYLAAHARARTLQEDARMRRAAFRKLGHLSCPANEISQRAIPSY